MLYRAPGSTSAGRGTSRPKKVISAPTDSLARATPERKSSGSPPRPRVKPRQKGLPAQADLLAGHCEAAARLPAGAGKPSVPGSPPTLPPVFITEATFARGGEPPPTPRHATTKRAPPRPGRGKPACGPGPALHPSPRGGGRDGGAFLPQVLAGGAAPTPPEEPCQPPHAAGGRERGHRGGGPGAGERGGAAPATHTRPASTRRPVPVPAPAVPAGGSPSIAAAVM